MFSFLPNARESLGTSHKSVLLLAKEKTEEVEVHGNEV